MTSSDVTMHRTLHDLVYPYIIESIKTAATRTYTLPDAEITEGILFCLAMVAGFSLCAGLFCMHGVYFKHGKSPYGAALYFLSCVGFIFGFATYVQQVKPQRMDGINLSMAITECIYLFPMLVFFAVSFFSAIPGYLTREVPCCIAHDDEYHARVRNPDDPSGTGRPKASANRWSTNANCCCPCTYSGLTLTCVYVCAGVLLGVLVVVYQWPFVDPDFPTRQAAVVTTVISSASAIVIALVVSMISCYKERRNKHSTAHEYAVPAWDDKATFVVFDADAMQGGAVALPLRRKGYDVCKCCQYCCRKGCFKTHFVNAKCCGLLKLGGFFYGPVQFFAMIGMIGVLFQAAVLVSIPPDVRFPTIFQFSRWMVAYLYLACMLMITVFWVHSVIDDYAPVDGSEPLVQIAEKPPAFVVGGPEQEVVQEDDDYHGVTERGGHKSLRDDVVESARKVKVKERGALSEFASSEFGELEEDDEKQSNTTADRVSRLAWHEPAAAPNYSIKISPPQETTAADAALLARDARRSEDEAAAAAAAAADADVHDESDILSASALENVTET